MNHTLQVMNADKARLLSKEIQITRRMYLKTIRSMETKLEHLVDAIACRQLGLWPGNKVHVIDPAATYSAACAERDGVYSVVVGVSVEHQDISTLLRLASGKKASPEFLVVITSPGGKEFLVYGPQARIKATLQRVREEKRHAKT